MAGPKEEGGERGGRRIEGKGREAEQGGGEAESPAPASSRSPPDDLGLGGCWRA